MNPSSGQVTKRPVVILSLDGGGARGISSLFILDHILKQIQDVTDADERPKACDVFDLIGGTGTGGIIAVILGRLGMDIRHSINIYKSLIDTTVVSASKIPPKLSSGAFSAAELEKAIKKAIQEICNDPRCIHQANGKTKTDACMHQDMLFRNEKCTKTAVLVLTKANIETLPTLLTTYDTSTSLAQCTISQVAKSASPANNLSGSAKIGRDEEEFVSAEYGYNNPCQVLIFEAQKQFPDRELMILSIGAGANGVVEIGHSSKSLDLALWRIATGSQQSHLLLQSVYGSSGVYHRFNVDNGLEDSKSQSCQVGNIAAHTRNYLQENETSIMKFVNAFRDTCGLPS